MTTTPTTPLTTVCPAELYLARRSTPASRATAQSALNTAARVLGAGDYTGVDWALDYAQAATIRAALNGFEPGWSKQIWSAVRQTAAEARRLRLIDADTLSSILELPAPRGSGGRRGCTPTDNDVGKLLAAAANDASLRGRRDAALLALLAGTGVRRAEASALTVDDVDVVGGVLRVRSGKGRRFREIPAPDWCLDTLADWLDVSVVSGPLLRQIDRWGRVGGAMSGHAIADVLHRLCDTAGVERCGPHGLRRYAVTGVLRSGDVGLAQRFAGHADLGTTLASYDARTADDLAAAVQRRPVPGKPPVIAAVA